MRKFAPQKETPWGTAYWHDGRWLVAHKIDGIHTISWLSRLVYAAAHGTIPPGFHIHHINEVTDDDRVENLRALSQADHNTLHKLGNCWRSFFDSMGWQVKVCSCCGLIKHVSLYYSNGYTKISHLPAYKPTCKKCQIAAAAA